MKLKQLLLFLSLIPMSLFGQEEKIALITNHDLYLTGESVYLGIACQMDEKPSSLSQILYVELIDQNNDARVQQIFSLQGGMFSGSVFLPSTLKTGNYALLAYTNWMKNSSPENFGTKLISVVNPFEEISSDFFVKDNLSQSSGSLKNAAVAFELTDNKIKPHDSLHITLEKQQAVSSDVFLSIKKSDVRSRHKNLEKIKYEEVTRDTDNYYLPEPYGFLVQGNVTGKNGQPISTTISLTNTDQNNSVYFSESDANGDFTFQLDEVQRSGSFLLRTVIDSKIEISNPFYANNIQWEIPELSIDPSLKEWILQRAQEVQIEDAFFAEKYEPTIKNGDQELFNFLPSKTYLLDDYTRFPKLEDPIAEYIPEVRIRTKDGKKSLSAQSLSYTGSSDSTLVLLNGIPVTSNEIFSVNPNYIESITALPHYTLINGNEFAGIIKFKTFDKYDRNIKITNTKRIRYLSPSYEAKGGPRLTDFRNQLLWRSASESTKKKYSIKASMSKGTYLLHAIDRDNNVVGSSTFTIE